MSKFLKISLVFLLVVTIFLGVVPHEAVAQDEPINKAICILGEPRTENFPDVSVSFRATDSNYHAIKSFSQNDFVFQEDGQKYTANNLTFDPKGIGLDLYIVIDIGTKSDLETVKAVITRFLDNAGIDGLDRITIIQAGDTMKELVKQESDFSKVKAQLNERISKNKLTYPVSIYDGITKALGMLTDKEETLCGRPRAILVLGAEQKSDGQENTQEANITKQAPLYRTPIHFVHLTKSNPGNRSTERFGAIAADTQGNYVPIKEFSTSSSDLDTSLFPQITALRGNFTATYRSISGSSGTRNLAVLFGNTAPTSEAQQTSYTVDLKPAKVTLINPAEGSDFARTATVYADPQFLFDIDVVPIEFKIEWPDSYNRVPSKIRVIGSSPSGDQTIEEINETEYSRSNYNLTWDVSNVTKEGANSLSVRIEVIDELGILSSTTPNHFTVTNVVPEAVAKQTTETMTQDLKQTKYIVYVLAGVVVVLIALIIIFRKKIAYAFSASGKIGKAIETVRRTIVGGTGRRSTPIARLEITRPTVEIKSIFTESVKLGRDPNVSDYTFFSLDSECSVSGEHAHLVRKLDGWKIIAVSQSGSPVFIDGQRIQMHQEVPIQSGQTIELGYQDLGSALFTFVEIAPPQKPNLADGGFQPDTQMQFDDGYRRTQVNLPEFTDPEFGPPPAFDDQMSMPDIFKDSSSIDDDFDALFNDLRNN